ncbi:MAG TPA: hypothetical protein VI814_03805 [Candidatus Limnocylindria bacterium]
MSLLSKESDAVLPAGFSDGVEFEETFPEEPAAPAVAPAPVAPPRLTLVRPAPEPEAQLEPTTAPVGDASEALYEEQLERRLRDAEELVTRTIETMRLEEERRLAEWVRERREEEERRLAARATTEDGLARRIEDMLTEWQARFEQRLEQRRLDDERMAERRRASDEERLRAWRTELERALSVRFADPRSADRAPLPDRNGELRTSVRDAISSATSARDVGRILRDVLSEITHTSAFAVALHHTERDDVAYRYRVASEDELGSLLRRDVLDDGPEGAAAHMDGWVRAHRAVRVGARNTTVHTAQLAIRDGEATVGVLTIQTEASAVPDALLSRVSDLVALAARRLADLRASGTFRGA